MTTTAAKPPRVAILLLAAGETLIWAALFYVFATLLLEWERSLGWAKTDLALGFTIAIAMAAISSPIAGRLIDNGYGRFVLSCGGLFGCAALAALATASTPLPVDAQGQALALTDAFKEDPDAMAWLWKDHSSLAEANEITTKAAALRPEYLAKCGGTYSSEW